MGGFFGITSKEDCVVDVFFGTDYHSHLGTRRAGMAAYDEEIGLQRVIHNIENSPFRTKFEHALEDMRGKSAIGCISDSDPQPLLIRSHLGTYAIATVGIINNADELDKANRAFIDINNIFTRENSEELQWITVAAENDKAYRNAMDEVKACYEKVLDASDNKASELGLR